MKQLFIPYHLALIARDKGFPNNTGSCLASWEDTPIHRSLHFGACDVRFLKAPLYQQVIDWIREKHNITISISNDTNKLDIWSFYLVNTIQSEEQNLSLDSKNTYSTYYEALNVAIEETFNIINHAKC